VWSCWVINDDGVPQQEVVALRQFVDAPNEKKTNLMSEHKLKQPRRLVKVFVRDGALVNELAIQKLIGGVQASRNWSANIVLPQQYSVCNVKCYSHTLDRCRVEYQLDKVIYSRIEGVHLRQFHIHLNGYFILPGFAANNRWWETMKSSMPSVSPTRWWSRFAHVILHTIHFNLHLREEFFE
jgi:hypothetical protein